METTEKPKRTYQKHKTEKKITVKHYVNMALGKSLDGNETNKVYPVYVEVTFNRKTARFKSKIPRTYWVHSSDSEKEEDEEYCDYVLSPPDINNKAELKSLSGNLKEVVEQDTTLITTIVEDLFQFNTETFNINYVPKIYHSEFYNLVFFVEWCLRGKVHKRIMELERDKKSDRFITERFNGLWDTKYSFSNKVSSISHLEFYKKYYPALEELRDTFCSQVWFLDIYVDTLKHPFYSKAHSNQSMTVNNNYAVFNLNPTILDFKTRNFQDIFLNTFLYERIEIKNVIYDIERLFQEKYREYRQSFISTLPKKIDIMEKEGLF
jgi:hypothetical protein